MSEHEVDLGVERVPQHVARLADHLLHVPPMREILHHPDRAELAGAVEREEAIPKRTGSPSGVSHRLVRRVEQRHTIEAEARLRVGL